MTERWRELIGDPGEVEEVLWVPLTTLASPSVRGEVTIRFGHESRDFPALRIDNRIVWGLTHRILTEFIEVGDRVKVTVRFRGREMAHQELGRDLLVRVEEDLKDYGTVEQYPKMEGRTMVMVLAPKPV